MDNIIMLPACLVIAMLLRRANKVPDNAPASINAFLVQVALPALTIVQIHSIRLDPALFLFEAGMAPQEGGSIVATQCGLNAKLISLMVGLGTVLSFITLPLWWQLFEHLAIS